MIQIIKQQKTSIMKKSQNIENQKVKRQSRKIGVAGGFINQLMGNNCSEPVVGEGATILHYSDRSAYEVIEVSNDGMSCVIRQMDAKFVGSAYGDERYEYSSNPDNGTMTLEWNQKKKAWGSVHYSIQPIKSLVKRLGKEYGWDWYKYLPNGYTIEDITVKNDSPFHQYKLVDGITKMYKEWNQKSVIFGVMEKYRDPHF